MDEYLDKAFNYLRNAQHDYVIPRWYFGDADPSGEVMDIVYKRKLIEYGIYNVEFVRLAVTKEQIDRFSLLHSPDPETLKKLKKEIRTRT